MTKWGEKTRRNTYNGEKRKENPRPSVGRVLLRGGLARQQLPGEGEGEVAIAQ